MSEIRRKIIDAICHYVTFANMHDRVYIVRMVKSSGEICNMLNIIFGDTENSIYHPPTYFDNTYRDEWITDPFSVEIIKDIDKSDVLSAHAISSPVLGSISTRELSGGVKTLILMKFDESGKIFNASACGDNCAKWVYEISKEKDLTINLHHIMDFSECKDFKAYITNIGKYVSNAKKYIDEAVLIEDK